MRYENLDAKVDFWRIELEEYGKIKGTEIVDGPTASSRLGGKGDPHRNAQTAHRVCLYPSGSDATGE